MYIIYIVIPHVLLPIILKLKKKEILRKVEHAVYHKIPYNWERPEPSDYSTMDEATRKVIEENVETIQIKPTDNETIAKLAEKVEYS